MEKLLIFGVSGLTGYKIANKAIPRYDVYGTYNSREVKLDNCFTSRVDLTNENEVQEIFSLTKPDIVVNTTALHNVDYCEENRDQAFNVNTLAIKHLHENSQKFGSKLIHISTDYVFDGKKNLPYVEDDAAVPISVYGQSKLDGERVLSANQNHIIIRPSVVYGWTPLELAGVTSSSGKPMNFAMWVLTKLYKNEPLKIVTDQFASATLADSLAESILNMTSTDITGLYHVSGLSCESRYEFTVKLAKKFGYDPALVLPTTSASFVQKAKRPLYSCLDCKKSIKKFGLALLTTERSLDIMKNQVEREAPHLIGNARAASKS